MFVKGYGFLSFAKNIRKYSAKSIRKTFSCRYSQKCLESAKKSGEGAFKTSSKRAIQTRLQ